MPAEAREHSEVGRRIYDPGAIAFIASFTAVTTLRLCLPHRCASQLAAGVSERSIALARKHCVS